MFDNVDFNDLFAIFCGFQRPLVLDLRLTVQVEKLLIEAVVGLNLPVLSQEDQVGDDSESDHNNHCSDEVDPDISLVEIEDFARIANIGLARRDSDSACFRSVVWTGRFNFAVQSVLIRISELCEDQSLKGKPWY